MINQSNCTGRTHVTPPGFIVEGSMAANLRLSLVSPASNSQLDTILLAAFRALANLVECRWVASVADL